MEECICVANSANNMAGLRLDRPAYVIEQLEVMCSIGILPAERAAPQPLWIDLEVEIAPVALSPAGTSDDIAAVPLDYRLLLEGVRALCNGLWREHYELQETLCHDICQYVLGLSPKITQCHTYVRKPTIDKAARAVGYKATMHQSRDRTS